MEEVAKMIIDGAVFVSTHDVNEIIKKAFPEASTIDVHQLNPYLRVTRNKKYVVDDWHRYKVLSVSDNVFYFKCTKTKIKRLVAHLKRYVELCKITERGSVSNPAPKRDTPSYGRGTLAHPKPKNPDDERFRVSDTESSQPSVTLKVKLVGLEEYKEKLNRLEKLVEELNSMEISIEVSKGE